MNLIRKFLHLCCAVVKSSISIIVSVVLILVIGMFECFSNIQESNILFGLYVGFVPSIVASVVMGIGDKYRRSCDAFYSILRYARLFIRFTDQLDGYYIEDRDKYNLLISDFYENVLVESDQLLYNCDFYKLSKKMRHIIDLYYSKEYSKSLIDSAKKELNDELSKFS